MANLRTWFESKWEGDSPFNYFAIPEAPEPTRLQVFAAFLAMDTGGYGFLSNDGPYRNSGLEMQEAHRWWRLKAYVEGWLDGTDGVDYAWISAAVKAEQERVMKLLGTWEQYSKKEEATHG